jgi:uncharacterized protein
MKSAETSVLKIYTSSTDKFGSQMLYEHIVTLAKENGISGVTVLRGIMGFGLSSTHISTSRYWELTEKLPVVIEIIDETETLKLFYKLLEPILFPLPKGVLVTLEPIAVLLHKKGNN